jgi:hypothetical protein
VGLPGQFPSLSRFLCAIGTHLLACWERGSLPLDQHHPVVPGRGSPLGRLGMLKWQQGENTTLQIPVGPLECCRRTQTETERTPKLSGSKFIKQAGTDSVDSCPKAKHREQRGSPYIPVRAGYRNGGGTACPIHDHMSFYWLF